MLHLVVSVDHIRLSAVNIVTKLLDTSILTLNLSIKVLRLILGGLDDANDFIELIVLIPDHLLLVLKDLSIVKITGLLILTVFTTLILSLFLLGSQGGLIAFQSSILLGQLPLDNFVDLLDEADTPRDLFLADARVLVRLVLIVIHELIKVAQIGL